MNDCTIVQCTYEQHAQAILDIFNEAIVNTTALFDYKPRTMQSMHVWFDAKRIGNFPVIGIEDAKGTLLAFGTFGSFRPHPAYKYTVEHSVYVHKDHRRKGLGKEIMKELIMAAQTHGVHAMIAGIEALNQESIALHEKFAFKHVGTLPQVGFKFGQWLDLAFYELRLATPVHPIDG